MTVKSLRILCRLDFPGETVRFVDGASPHLDADGISLIQAKDRAEAAMHAMQKAMTDDGVAEIAAAVTARIADIYAAGGRSVEDRDIAVHAAVAEAVRKAARGEKHWNEHGLARKARAH